MQGGAPIFRWVPGEARGALTRTSQRRARANAADGPFQPPADMEDRPSREKFSYCTLRYSGLPGLPAAPLRWARNGRARTPEGIIAGTLPLTVPGRAPAGPGELKRTASFEERAAEAEAQAKPYLGRCGSGN